MKAPKRKTTSNRVEAVPSAWELAGGPAADKPEGDNPCFTNFAMIREPALLIAAQEAAKFLDTAHEELRGIRARLFREQIEYCPSYANERVTLEGLIRRLSTDAACLVGELRTIAGKLG